METDPKSDRARFGCVVFERFTRERMSSICANVSDRLKLRFTLNLTDDELEISLRQASNHLCAIAVSDVGRSVCSCSVMDTANPTHSIHSFNCARSIVKMGFHMALAQRRRSVRVRESIALV